MSSFRHSRVSENELLISLVRMHPAIWDQRSSLYRDIDRRFASWTTFAKGMGLEGTADDIKTVSQRWRNLRDTFARKNKELKKKSGSAAGDCQSSWPYFEQMIFLRDVVDPSDSSSNVRAISTDAEVGDNNSADEVRMGCEDESPCTPARQILAEISGSRSNRPTDPSNQSPCQSLPPPQAISSAFSNAAPHQPYASPSNGKKESKKRKKSDIFDAEIENINKELQDKLDSNEHFCLSLAKDINKIPEELQGYCKIQVLGIIMKYRTGKVSPSVVQVGQLEDP